ncbi:MAG: hypothetical protein H0W88_05165 [Parachlamydiaceae bacterium]|nr:hypothetical protein [Parachlamydiaceae bacterium]
MTAIFDMMDKFEVFRSLNMEITIADVHTEEDRKKLTDNINTKLKQKIIQRLFPANAYTATTLAVLVGCTRLFFNLSVKSRKGFGELYGLAMAPVLLVLCRLVYTIAQGIIMVFKKKFQLDYAKAITKKVQEYFADTSRRDFLVSVDLDGINPKNSLEFTNGLKGCRIHDLLIWKIPLMINKIVEAIKQHGIASYEDYRNKKAISKNDPDWKEDQRLITKTQLDTLALEIGK